MLICPIVNQNQEELVQFYSIREDFFLDWLLNLYWCTMILKDQVVVPGCDLNPKAGDDRNPGCD